MTVNLSHLAFSLMYQYCGYYEEDMEGILLAKETKEPAHLRSHSKKSSLGTTLPSPSYLFRGYTPWSVQATYSGGSRYSQLSLSSATEHAKINGFMVSQTKEKKHHSNPWKAISAPVSFAYSCSEGTFANGRGCTWTPYYFRFCQPSLQPTNQSATNSSEIEPLKDVLQDSNELKATHSWIWCDQPQPSAEKCNDETFINLMRSPYLLRRHTGTPLSSQKLQSSHKCEAWLKSSKF